MSDNYYLNDKIRESGLSGKFIAKRLYKQMGFSNPDSAAAFISMLRQREAVEETKIATLDFLRNK